MLYDKFNNYKDLASTGVFKNKAGEKTDILKHLNPIISIFVLGIVFLCGNNFAEAASLEKVDSFDVTIQMNADASIEVTEEIVYDFGASQKHGFYRDIPVRYEARGGNYNLRMSDISVVDENGAAYNFVVSDSGRYKDIKIGDADVLVTGKKTYVIRYKIKRVINYFDDHDELYWNVTGNEFTVPIGQASAKIIFPDGLKEEDVEIGCYAGVAGSKLACSSSEYLTEDGNVVGAYFAEQDLPAASGLTFAVGLPKGVLYQPIWVENMRDTLLDNIVIFVPFLIFFLAFYIWKKRGKDPQGRGTIITEFDVSDDVTPAEAGTMVDEKCGRKELSAEIIELAVKGYLKIKREEKKPLFASGAEYTFDKLKEADDSLSGHERILFDGIFEHGNSVKLSDLKETFFKKYNLFVKDVYSSVEQKGYFFKDPQKARTKYFTSYFVLTILLVLISSGLSGSALGEYAAASLVISLIIAGIFALAMPQKSAAGVMVKEKILGLKLYMTVAEKDRMEFHNAPEKNPEQFEKLLPYAIALGVEKRWAKQFEGIYNASPSWYEDSRGFNNFSAIYLVDNLGDFSRDFNTYAATPPAASGSSGFGGGGFSGGGFGGGGGGSW